MQFNALSHSDSHFPPSFSMISLNMYRNFLKLLSQLTTVGEVPEDFFHKRMKDVKDDPFQYMMVIEDPATKVNCFSFLFMIHHVIPQEYFPTRSEEEKYEEINYHSCLSLGKHISCIQRYLINILYPAS
jgi:hypothetical protein